MSPNPARRLIDRLRSQPESPDRSTRTAAKPDVADAESTHQSSDVRRITLISKPGCHLCDEARAVITEVAAETGAQVEEINMLTRPDLIAEYAEQIPVTLVDGRQHDYWRVDAGRLRAALAKPPR